MKKKILTHRQGDTYLLAIDKVPEGFKLIETRPIAYGEATGHTHRIVDIPKDLAEIVEKSTKDGIFTPPTDEVKHRVFNLALSPTVQMYSNEKGDLCLVVKKKGLYVHETHEVQVVSPGVKKFYPQHGYSDEGEYKRLAD